MKKLEMLRYIRLYINGNLNVSSSIKGIINKLHTNSNSVESLIGLNSILKIHLIIPVIIDRNNTGNRYNRNTCRKALPFCAGVLKLYLIVFGSFK